MSKCENCRAYNAHVIYLKDDRYILCPRCLKILEELDEEYEAIITEDDEITRELLNKS